MMKTSITTLLAFAGMLGDSNALQLTTMTQTTEPTASVVTDTVPAGAEPTAMPAYSPNRSVINELREIFTTTHGDSPDDRFGRPRMSYRAWAQTMTNYQFEPENHGCVEINAWMAGDACETCDIGPADWLCTTGTKPTFTNPQIVSCDGHRGKATMCADPGLHRHFTNVDADSEGGLTISFDQYRQAVRSLNAELDTEKNGAVYRLMTAAGVNADKIVSVTYNFVETYSNTAGGTGSTRDITYKREYGRNSNTTVTHEVMANVKAHQNWNIMGQDGGVEVEGQYDFSYVESAHSYNQVTEEETYHFDLEQPVAIYYKSVNILTNSGEVTVYGGTHISFVPGGEPFQRVITFQDDGVTVESDISHSHWGRRDNLNPTQ